MTFGQATERRAVRARLLPFVTVPLLVGAVRLFAADPPAPTASSRLTTPVVPPGYRAPSGFGEVRWGDTLSAVAAKTHGLRLTFSRSVVENEVEHGLVCYLQGSVSIWLSAESIQKCLYDGPTSRLDEDPPPPVPLGFYLVAEYVSIDPTPQRYEGVPVAVSYLLCIVKPPQAGRTDIPEYGKKDLRLCGLRFDFEGRELLPLLEKRFGQSTNELETLPANLTLEHRRWCGSRAPRDSYIPCLAAVAYAFDPKTQRGQLVMATPALYTVFGQIRIKVWSPFRKGAERYFAFMYEQPQSLLPKKGPFICPTCALDRFTIPARLRRSLEPDP